MPFQHSRSALALVLSLTLAACGSDEPDATTAAPVVADAKSAASSAGVAPVVENKPAAPQLPVAASAYERGQRSLTEVPGMRRLDVSSASHQALS